MTGSLASSISIKTTNSYNIGSATLGLAGLYLGNAGGSTTIRLVSASSVSSSATYTIPDIGSTGTFAFIDSAQKFTNDKTFENCILTINSTALGLSGLSRTMRGLELIAGGLNTTSKYLPAIKWMGADSNLTTENPKLLAAITGYATETYGADTAGGMGLEFFVTPNSPGTTSLPTSAMRIANNLGLNVGEATDATTRFYANVSTSWNSTDYPFVFQNLETANLYGNTVKIIGGGGAGGVGSSSSTILLIEDNSGDQKIRVSGTGAFFNAAHPTTASAANAHLNSSTGLLSRSTSSRRYKENVVDLNLEVDSSKIYELRPIAFDSTIEGEDERFTGLIAEEVAEHLPDMVEYNAKGEPEGVKYAMLTVHLLSEIKKLRDRVATLES